MAYTTQYIGSRYVPQFADPAEWNNARTYEPLTIVLNKGNSYTSRQFVPVGIELTNEDYWLETGNYNAQIEQYRQQVLLYNNRITHLESLSTFNVMEYGAKGDGLSDDTAAFITAIEAAISYINKGNVIFSTQQDTVWQANIVIPNGTYNISSVLQIAASNGLVQNDNRVCGINLIGIGMPVVRFNGASGFKIDGCFFTCKNIEINNAATAFDFFDSYNYQPYVEFDNVIIKRSHDGIHFSTGTYLSRFTHVICIDITDIGFDFGQGTSLYVSNCYVSGCSIGYKIGAYVYSCLIACACDSAEIAYSVNRASNVKFIECGSENPSKYHYSFENIVRVITLDSCCITQNKVTPIALYHFKDIGNTIKFNDISYFIDLKVDLLDGIAAYPPVFNNLDTRNINPPSRQILQTERKNLYLSKTENPIFIINSTTNVYTIVLHFAFSYPHSTWYYEADVLVTNNGTTAKTKKLREDANVIIPDDVTFVVDNETHILSINGNRLTDMRGYVQLNCYSNVYLDTHIE